MTSRNALTAIVLVACSGGRHHGVDAPPIDVAVDTLQTTGGDPPPNAVALYVTVLGAGAPNVPVYFQRPDGTVELAAITDTRGIAWALASAGDDVTAIEPPGPSGALVLSTFAAVQPGDRLHLDLQPVTAFAQRTVTLHVPVQAGAASYAVHNACGDPVVVGATAAGDVTFADCGGGVIDLVVTPLDSGGLPSLGALFAPDVAIASGTDVIVGGTYAAFDTASFQYDNVPSNVTFIGAYQAILTARGRVFDTSAGAPRAGGTVSTSALEPHTPAGTTALTVSVETPTDTEPGQQTIVDWKAWGSPYTVDLGAARLPEFAAPATFAPDAATVQWTERGGGLTPQVVRASVHVVRPQIPTSLAWTWRIAGPRTGTSITLPHLPNDGFDYNVGPSDTVGTVDVTTVAVPGGYDAVRPHAFDELIRAMTGASGTMVIEESYSPPL